MKKYTSHTLIHIWCPFFHSWKNQSVSVLGKPRVCACVWILFFFYSKYHLCLLVTMPFVVTEVKNTHCRRRPHITILHTFMIIKLIQKILMNEWKIISQNRVSLQNVYKFCIQKFKKQKNQQICSFFLYLCIHFTIFIFLYICDLNAYLCGVYACAYVSKYSLFCFPSSSFFHFPLIFGKYSLSVPKKKKKLYIKYICIP